MTWTNDKPRGTRTFAKGRQQGFTAMFNKAKRLLLIKRIHRAMLRAQALAQSPLEDESTDGSANVVERMYED